MTKIPSDNLDDLLSDLFYNLSNPSSFSGINRLYDAAQLRKNEISTNPTKKRIKEWLTRQKVYTTHYPARKTFKRVKTITYGIDFIWEADLADVSEFSQQNSGIHFLLLIVDTFSKYFIVKPLKNKSMNNVSKAFREIFEKGRQPLYLRSDMGTEFWNRQMTELLKEYKIHQYAARNITKASQAERGIRTLKSKIFKFLANKGGKRRYIDDLDSIIDGINNSVHRVTKMKPAEVKLEHQEAIFHKLFPQYYLTYGGYLSPERRYLLKVGDFVRIAKATGPFYKSYKQTMTDEVYIVSEVLPRAPPLYKLKTKTKDGDEGEEIIGSFYGNELIKITL